MARGLSAAFLLSPLGRDAGHGNATLGCNIAPRGRLGTRAGRGVVRAKGADYSGEALIYVDWQDASATRDAV